MIACVSTVPSEVGGVEERRGAALGDHLLGLDRGACSVENSSANHPWNGVPVVMMW